MPICTRGAGKLAAYSYLFVLMAGPSNGKLQIEVMAKNTHGAAACGSARRVWPATAFTLIELLVVIAIIGFIR
jgi:prepilin-type N-terminal cleavage/methylation domain-containing protein